MKPASDIKLRPIGNVFEDKTAEQFHNPPPVKGTRSFLPPQPATQTAAAAVQEHDPQPVDLQQPAAPKNLKPIVLGALAAAALYVAYMI